MANMARICQRLFQRHPRQELGMGCKLNLLSNRSAPHIYNAGLTVPHLYLVVCSQDVDDLTPTGVARLHSRRAYTWTARGSASIHCSNKLFGP